VDDFMRTTGALVGTPVKFPAIHGSDVAGIVVGLGEGVTKFAVGDKVFYQGGVFDNRTCGFQQYSVIDVDIAAKIPHNLNFDQAATIPVGMSCAFMGLYGEKWERGGAEYYPFWREGGRNKYSGEPIVIFGGSTSVGQYAIQLAKLSGFAPIITTASDRHAKLINSLGATHILDRDSDVAEEVKKITKNPIRLVFDAISTRQTQNLGYDIVTPGGKFIRVLPLAIDAEKIVPEKEIVGVLGISHIPGNRAIAVEFYSVVSGLLQSGDLKPMEVMYADGGLSAIPKQVEAMTRNDHSGKKLVVHPSEIAP